MSDAASNHYAAERLSDVYAQALLGAATGAGLAREVGDELTSLVEDLLGKLPQLGAALASPRIDEAAKLRLIDSAFSGRMQPLLLNFLKVAARRRRLEYLRDFERSYRKLYNAAHGRVEVLLRTAAELPPEELAGVAARLQTVLGAEVVLRHKVDPTLLGGLVIRIGDTLYDGSVANRLARLREETLAKAIEEIRSTLDRFAPAGAA